MFLLHKKSVESPCARSVEIFQFCSELMSEGEVEICQRSPFGKREMTPWLESSLPSAEEHEWQILSDVSIAVLHFTAVEHDAVVEEAAVAFFDVLHFCEEEVYLRGIPATHGCVLRNERLLIFVMTHAVMVIFHAVEEGEILTAESVSAHEGRHSCCIGL